MFRDRLITTIFLAPLFLIFLYYAPSLFFTILVVLLYFAAIWEWQQLVPMTTPGTRIIFIVCSFLVLILAHFMFNTWLTLGLVIFLLSIFLICLYPILQNWWGHPLIVVVVAFVTLPLMAQSFIKINHMPERLLSIYYLLLLVWGADIGAYLIGRTWGENKLIPAVSPGKTIEGILGGLFFTILIALGWHQLLRLHFIGTIPPLTLWLVKAIAIFFSALVGDLLVSMLKRRVHIKDTGKLLPGHGGLLDRIDSFLTAAPIFYLLFHWQGL